MRRGYRATERRYINMHEEHSQSDPAPRCSGSPDSSLPVIAPPRIRRSRMSRWRARCLAIVHLLIIAHIGHWVWTGRTLSPVEPSEAMYTLNEGHLNAGFLFFAAAIVSTLLLGRFVCGWGCHVIAYQDICTWLLKRLGVRPRPFRSRVLVFAPLALAVYMFVWPTAYRWWMGIPSPEFSNHLLTSEFWRTFPGATVAVVTIVVCGFIIVYLLGSKGFCTYACPYGGFFRLADKVAPGQIVVTEACKHCGHCTAACTSNVRVHEEVAKYGTVVDPGCMKCLDCVTVCPSDALHFGFARPSIIAATKGNGHKSRKNRYDFALWEECVMVVVGVAALLSYRGLYNQVPLLLAMATACITGYATVLLLRQARLANVRLQNLQLRRGASVTRVGTVSNVIFVALLVLTCHSGLVQFQVWRGRSLFRAARVGDVVWAAENTWWQEASDEQRDRVEAGLGYLERADAWGLMATPEALSDLVWLHLAKGDDDRAESVIGRLIDLDPDQPEPYRSLGDVMRKMDRLDDAQRWYHHALTLEPGYVPAREGLCAMLVAAGRFDDATAEYQHAIAMAPDDVSWRMGLCRLLLRTGRTDEAIDELREVTRLDPSLTEAQYNLGMALLQQGRANEAIDPLTQAVHTHPDLAMAHYNLGVATFMTGRPVEALPHIREAIRLDPGDRDARAFQRVVLEAIER